MADYIGALNFTPTPSQNSAFSNILKDMQSDKNMSRIVSGDVGSGKTAVAFFAMVACVLGGKQCALMAPTEILAKQHFAKFKALAGKFGISCALLTSSVSEIERRGILQDLQDGTISCVIGTQSLISQEVQYNNLALAVIDEQHKFGVNERRLLESKGAVDVLSLTATPIPRSMALTFYDDVAISFIQKREDAKTSVKTEIVHSVDEGVDRILGACKDGKQAFIVCPSIVDAEGYDIMSIESFMRDYGKRFDGIDLQILHGKMNDFEKERAMNEFASGKSQVLVATTVVEVGIDTRASEILILGADRFGLASLHQLRGRVGRDGSLAHCFVHSNGTNDKALNRLTTFCAHNDGP
ncbi:MAG: DEAD/DEAH box helicase, partial [Clostridia bacterium]|nr:DEAD/DEAH box helicase [Clostridia bacterium]